MCMKVVNKNISLVAYRKGVNLLTLLKMNIPVISPILQFKVESAPFSRNTNFSKICACLHDYRNEYGVSDPVTIRH